jgi:branched-chain amino acid transport system ATP-binding protein
MLLGVQDIRVHYNELEALKGVSLELAEGSITVVIGPNGAGKTTLLRSIIGLKKLTSGNIWFQGRRIDGTPAQNIVASGIALVPEGRRVFPYMTVLENLQVGAYLRKDREGISKDLGRIYQLFPILKERTRQQAGSLSGGEQQMLAIARALMTKAKLILMDEPSLGLSPMMVTAVAEVVTNINQDWGTTVLLVEQNSSMALKIAQWGYLLETGSIVLHDSSENLIKDERVREAYLGG